MYVFVNFILIINKPMYMTKLLFGFLTICILTTACTSETETTNLTENTESTWKKAPIKDEFGDSVPGKFGILARFDGEMSNSAVANEKLVVSMQIQDDILYSIFYEYGSPPQSSLPDRKFLPLRIKLANNEIIEIEQFLLEDIMYDSDDNLLNVLMRETEPFKVIVDLSKVDRYESTKYTYEVDPKGLSMLLN